MMSQPVRNVSAPRLAPPRRNSRRVGSGISLVASLIRSLGSTPGMTLGITLRMRGMAPSLSSDDHGAQRLRHHEGHDHMDQQKADDRRHGKEMNIAGRIIAAEERG